MADEVQSVLPVSITFKTARCENVYYYLHVGRDKFSLESFRANFSKQKDKERAGTVCAPKDPATGDYHVHADWVIDADEVRFTIDYESGPKPHESDEREPFAEQFMEWLGQFFKHENAHAHIHAEFEYELETRESKFPLPLKTNLGPEGPEAEINGIRLTLPQDQRV